MSLYVLGPLLSLLWHMPPLCICCICLRRARGQEALKRRRISWHGPLSLDPLPPPHPPHLVLPDFSLSPPTSHPHYCLTGSHRHGTVQWWSCSDASSCGSCCKKGPQCSTACTIGTHFKAISRSGSHFCCHNAVCPAVQSSIVVFLKLWFGVQ